VTLEQLHITYPHIHSVVDGLKQHPFYGQDAFFTKIEKGLPLEKILEFISDAGYEVSFAVNLRQRIMTMYDVVFVDCLFAIERYEEVDRSNLLRMATIFLTKSNFLGEERSALRTWIGQLERAKEDFDREYYLYKQPYCLKHIIDPAITVFWDLEYFQARSIVLNHDKAQLLLYLPAWFDSKQTNTETMENLYSYAEYGRFGVTKTFQYV
jgi:hypothetical protein